MALNPSNSSNLEQLALKGLMPLDSFIGQCYVVQAVSCMWIFIEQCVMVCLSLHTTESVIVSKSIGVSEYM